MKGISKAVFMVAAITATSALAAGDMLPLKQGIYVPVARPCKGASNADMVNYWGGNSSIGAAQGVCKIRNVVKNGNVYTISERCSDIQTGSSISGPPTVVTIMNPSNFKLAGTSFRYCGPKVQF